MWYTRDCLICKKPFCRNPLAKYCIKCTKIRDKKKGFAHNKVAKAIRDGILKKLDGSIKCVDCGDIAKCYDHRDYARPLDVDPVCWSCDKQRGEGKNSY